MQYQLRGQHVPAICLNQRVRPSLIPIRPITATGKGKLTDDLDAVRSVVSGRKIRELRRRFDMTLDRLASAAGISKPFLSQIERDRATPSISSLVGIAKALGVTPQSLIGPHSDGRTVQRASEVNHLTLKASTVTLSRLSGSESEYGIDVFRLRLPRGNTCVTISVRPGDPLFIHVVDGDLLVDSEQDALVLRAGDSASYRDCAALGLRNRSDSDVFVLCVGTSMVACAPC